MEQIPNYFTIQMYCPKNHELKWSQSYLNKVCPICKTSTMNYSRWECLYCKEKYCVSCKIPQIFNNRCPLNHEMIEKELHANRCDCCRQSVNGKGFRDRDCDFDLCEKCMSLMVKED